MRVLESELRRSLERTIIQARKKAEDAADKALRRYGMHLNEPPSTLAAEERAMRRTLVAQKSQLDGYQALVEQCAYEHWHRLMFARFLAENRLLIHPSLGVPISLEECEDQELRDEFGASDAYDLAARFAASMLPAVFRPDDALLQVQLAPEDRNALEALVKGLPKAVFEADDSLGWTYQFWQTERKAQVNKASNDVEGNDISAVTQLFTENYMVRFLLENTVGAWWLHRHPDSPLGKSWQYYKPEIPHDFSGYPEDLGEITFMDPCCGSGHFLVEAFLLFQSMYCQMGLSEREAGDAAIRNNIRGLELDPRCTQIAAFNLALAAWRHGGYRQLPEIHIACSGLPLKGTRDRWERLAHGQVELAAGMALLHDVFSKAPDLGSLIHPPGMFDALREAKAHQLLLENMPGLEREKMLERAAQVHWNAIQRLMEKALASEERENKNENYYAGVRASGLAQAARMLSDKYWFAVTNPPFLLVSKAGKDLKEFCAKHHREAKKDLATCFIERLRAFAHPGAEYALVTPQNWLFLTSDAKFRRKMLKEQRFLAVVRYGEGAFESSAAAGAFAANLIFANQKPAEDDVFFGFDASAPRSAAEKAALLRRARVPEAQDQAC